MTGARAPGRSRALPPGGTAAVVTTATLPAAPDTAYGRLVARFARLGALDDAIGTLDWDAQTMLPSGAADGRSAQLATLRVLRHEQLTAPEVEDLLDAAEADAASAAGILDAWAAANLREMRRLYRHAAAVPAELVEAASRANSACERAWRGARADDAFADVVPTLTEVVVCQRAVAAAKAAVFGIDPYDALLDGFEPSLTMATVTPLFDDLAVALPPLLDRVLAVQAAAPAPLSLEGPFPVAAQRALGEALMGRAGFDFARGRLDVSLHPFCGGAADDVRLTTRYDEADFTSSLMGILHETGHALYEQGLPTAWRHQPVGQARGMAMHESQSLIIEMQAGRSREFLTFLAPHLTAAFGGSGPAWEPTNLCRLYHRVGRGLIRVDADEISYPAHIILRTRLERALIDGALAPADLPAAWRDGMAELLGVTPPDDRSGCLQDIHWYCGAFGYFPTYTLGALVAAQLFAAAERDLPALPDALGDGDFGPLVGWLNRGVHALGSRLPAPEMVEAVTGATLGTAAFKRHLTRRYLGE